MAKKKKRSLPNIAPVADDDLGVTIPSDDSPIFESELDPALLGDKTRDTEFKATGGEHSRLKPNLEVRTALSCAVLEKVAKRLGTRFNGLALVKNDRANRRKSVVRVYRNSCLAERDLETASNRESYAGVSYSLVGPNLYVIEPCGKLCHLVRAEDGDERYLYEPRSIMDVSFAKLVRECTSYQLGAARLDRDAALAYLENGEFGMRAELDKPSAMSIARAAVQIYNLNVHLKRALDILHRQATIKYEAAAAKDERSFTTAQHLAEVSTLHGVLSRLSDLLEETAGPASQMSRVLGKVFEFEKPSTNDLPLKYERLLAQAEKAEKDDEFLDIVKLLTTAGNFPPY